MGCVLYLNSLVKSNQNKKQGYIGEALVLYVLRKFVYAAYLVDADGKDIVAFEENTEKVFRIQVKTTFKISRDNRLKPDSIYQFFEFSLGKGKDKKIPSIKDYDIVAFVAMPYEKVMFKHIQDFSPRKSIKIPVQEFTDLYIEKVSLTQSIYRSKNDRRIKKSIKERRRK